MAHQFRLVKYYNLPRFLWWQESSLDFFWFHIWYALYGSMGNKANTLSPITMIPTPGFLNMMKLSNDHIRIIIIYIYNIHIFWLQRYKMLILLSLLSTAWNILPHEDSTGVDWSLSHQGHSSGSTDLFGPIFWSWKKVVCPTKMEQLSI